jgi:REP element-mobilizing transposase RayT
MRRLRFQSGEWKTHFVTCRNIMGFLLMRPDPHTNRIIAGALAYAKEKSEAGIELHAYVFMSNHYHMLITSRDQRTLSNFMCRFNGSLGKELGVIHNFHGKIWHSRYTASEVLDDKALEERYRYIFKNSIKENLVEHPRDWPGLHAYRSICEGEVVKGIWINRTTLYQAKQRAQLKKNKGKPKPKEAKYTTELTLTLDGVPPLWEGMSDEAYRARCQRIADEVVAECAALRRQEGKSVLGVEGILAQEVIEPRLIKRSPRPLCHAVCMKAQALFKAQYQAFIAHFFEASAHLRTYTACHCCTPEVTFPEGGVPLFGGG